MNTYTAKSSNYEKASQKRSLRLIFFRMHSVLLLLFLLACGILLHYSYLQIAHHQSYHSLSENNRINIVPIEPARGNIVDRNGIPLATNRLIYHIELQPYRIESMEETISQIENIVYITVQQKKSFYRKLRKKRAFSSIPLTEIDTVNVARIAVNLHLMNGVEITATPVRHYVYADAFAHVCGYIDEIDDNDLENISPLNYEGAKYIGKQGVEKFYETDLRGSIGHRYLETSAQGRSIQTLRSEKAIKGKDLMLALDFKLQQAAHSLLSNYEGAIVVMNPTNGDILALASRPSYNPNAFLDRSLEWHSKPGSHNRKPFFNRAVSGQYPPGSTIKPLVALSALKNKVVDFDETFFAGRYYSLPNSSRRYRDWRKWGHGWVDLKKSIVQSSDVFFYDVAHRLGIRNLHRIFTDFGIGSPTGLDMPNEKSGLVPSPEWKRKKFDQPWFLGETLIVGIGQGYMLTTPLQLASAISMLANRGKFVQPHILKAQREDKDAEHNWHPFEPIVEEKVEFSDEYWQYVIESMVDSVYKQNGTAHSAGFDSRHKLAAKTGTVQIKSFGENEERSSRKLPKRARDHAVFVGFAPYDKPEIVFVVLVEHAMGGGGRIAAPLAKQLLDIYFNHKQLLTPRDGNLNTGQLNENGHNV